MRHPANDFSHFFFRSSPYKISMEPTAERLRVNFTSEELMILISVVWKWKIILGKLESTVTKDSERAAWEAITGAVNAVSPVVQDCEEVLKKLL